jgi:hypothetical protein
MSKIGALRDLVVALLLEHERDGTIPTNARFLFYELVQRGQISKVKTGVRRGRSGSERCADRRPRGWPDSVGLARRRNPIAGG